MKPKRNIFIFESAYTLSNYLMKKWHSLARESVETKGRFTVALSGGRTPLEFYCKLSNLDDFGLWKKTHIFLTDERFCSFDEEASNFRMIKENLLNYVRIPEENIHSIATNHVNVSTCASQYEEKLKSFFDFKEGDFPSFDFMLLGLGEDGHTASLFPWDYSIKETTQLVVPVSSDQLSYERISLSLPVLNNASNIFFIAQGSQKSSILEQIIEQNRDYPASYVHTQQGSLSFLLDKEAAGRLSYRDSFVDQDDGILIQS